MLRHAYTIKLSRRKKKHRSQIDNSKYLNLITVHSYCVTSINNNFCGYNIVTVIKFMALAILSLPLSNYK